MKRITAIFGIILAFLSVDVALYSILPEIQQSNAADGGAGSAFAPWIFSVVLAGIAMLLFAISAIARIARRFSIRNLVRLIIVGIMVVVWIVLACPANLILNVIWNVALVLLALMEIRWLFQWR